jgi:hypothetical protein
VISTDEATALAYSPTTTVAEIETQSPTLLPGDKIDYEGTTLTLGAVEYVVTPDSLRCYAWCDAEARQTRAADAMRAIVEQITTQRLDGIYRYRVVRMVGDRCDLQAARPSSGVPDLIAISMFGAPGIHAQLTPGVEVGVQFFDGDRAQPVITAFAGKGSAGHVPVTLDLVGGGRSIARVGDLVSSGGPGTTVTFDLPPGGSMTPTPMLTLTPYLVSFGLIPPTAVLAAPLYGSIASGSVKGRCG